MDGRGGSDTYFATGVDTPDRVFDSGDSGVDTIEMTDDGTKLVFDSFGPANGIERIVGVGNNEIWGPPEATLDFAGVTITGVKCIGGASFINAGSVPAC